MSAQYQNIGLTVKSDLDHKEQAVEQVFKILCDYGATVYADIDRLDGVTCLKDVQPLSESTDLDLMIVIGGDGTILRAVRQLPSLNVPILSINRGTIGFLAEVPADGIEDALPQLLSGDAVIDKRAVLDVQIVRDGSVIHSGIALNEAVIAQGTIARLVNLETYVNNEPLTMFHADGLIIATPTGSTAYSLAAGGPIVHPSQAATILTPINPHSFSQKPVVMDGSSTIDVHIVPSDSNKYNEKRVVLTLDGQVSYPLEDGDHIQTKVHDTRLQFLRRKEDTFFSTLRQKLKWGERTEG